MWLYFWQLMKDQVGIDEEVFWAPLPPSPTWSWAQGNAIESHGGRAWKNASWVAHPNDEDIPF